MINNSNNSSSDNNNNVVADQFHNKTTAQYKI